MVDDNALLRELGVYGDVEEISGVSCVIRHHLAGEGTDVDARTADLYAIVAGSVVFIAIAVSDKPGVSYCWEPAHEFGANFYVRVSEKQITRDAVARALQRIAAWATPPLQRNEIPIEL